MPESQHEYGLWAREQSKKFKPVGTPVAFYKLPPMPGTPTGFEIEAGNGMARLTWNKMSNALAYIVYFSMDGKTFKRRFKKPIETNDIVIGVLENDRDYYFCITAVSHYGKETKMVV